MLWWKTNIRHVIPQNLNKWTVQQTNEIHCSISLNLGGTAGWRHNRLTKWTIDSCNWTTTPTTTESADGLWHRAMPFTSDKTATYPPPNCGLFNGKRKIKCDPPPNIHRRRTGGGKTRSKLFTVELSTAKGRQQVFLPVYNFNFCRESGTLRFKSPRQTWQRKFN